jgi:hypothetical protein
LGVLLSGIANALLWEHPEIFKGHGAPLLFCLIALPVIGGILTPEKPAYTGLIFVVGSVPPWFDIPSIPIGVWPLAFIYGILTQPLHRTNWEEVPAELPLLLGLFAFGLAQMAIFLGPLVFLGWLVRRKWRSSRAS